MKPTEVKQEYQLQIWSSMIQEQKASGLSIKNWCMENGVSENSYYYRLRKIRQTACAALAKIGIPAPSARSLSTTLPEF